MDEKKIITAAAERSGTPAKNWVVSCHAGQAVCLSNETDGLIGYMEDAGNLDTLATFRDDPPCPC